jgi:hypothetical protein
MARKKTTAMAQWDRELAELANEAADQEAGTGGGSFFSLRGGQLTFDGAPVPGNEMAVVVLDSVMENVYFEGDFDPDNPAGPKCYAYAREESALKPHEAVKSPQSEQCSDCPHNQWGTADRGRGKACKNRRRLGVLSGGTITRGDVELEEDPDHFARAELGILPLPPTSLNSWGAYVKSLAVTKRPPLAVYTRVSVVADPKTQFKVQFELIQTVPNEIVAVLLKRNKELRETNGLDFPYPEREEVSAPAPKKGTRRKTTKKKVQTKKY